jgi:phage gp36-like protein
MAYITDEDFEQAFGQSEAHGLLEDGNDFAKTEIAAASLINGFLGSRYTLPLASTPDLVKGWALDITRYRLWDDAAPEEVRRRYEDALKQLKQVSDGTISLPIVIAAPTGNNFDGASYSNCRVFDECSLKGY